MSFTTMDRPTATLPPALAAVTVYCAVAWTTVGVPLMIPVAASRLRPTGSGGDTEYDATRPPPILGGFAAIRLPLAYTTGFAAYVKSLGGATGVTTGDVALTGPLPT